MKLKEHFVLKSQYSDIVFLSKFASIVGRHNIVSEKAKLNFLFHLIGQLTFIVIGVTLLPWRTLQDYSAKTS